MIKNKTSNFADDLFQSISIITTEIVKGVSFDQTKICTITDDSNSKNGEYEVSDGSLIYFAKCENTTYQKGEQVRVTIMNGDMNEDKYIVGKYIAKNSIKPISYISPLDKMLDITGNIIPPQSPPPIYGLAANGTQMKQVLYNQKLTHYYDTKIYNTLYVAADFQSLLSDSNVKSGNYGLAIRLGEQNKDGVAELKLCLDSSDMFGDPYAFSFFSEQAMCFDITSLENIAYIQVEFYQDGNFETRDGIHLAPAILDSQEWKNLLISNIRIGFGSSLEKFTDNTVKLYTNDNLTYNTELATKHLRFAWYNKDENNKYLGFSDGINHPDYDEITDYILENRENARLRQYQNDNMPKDENALRMAAEISEAQPLIEKIANILKSKIAVKLTSFANSLLNLPITKEKFDGEAGIINKTNETAILLNSQIEQLYNYYFDIFKYASQYNMLPETVGEPASAPSYPAVENINILFSTIQEEYNTILTIIDTLLEELAAEIKKDENKGFQGDYDYYIKQLTPLLDEIKKIDESIEWDLDNDTKIEQYRNKPQFPYNEQLSNVEQIPNRYCVYWYRYDAAAPGDAVMPKGWAQIPNSKNIGVPEEDPENLGYLAKSPSFNTSTVKVELDTKTKTEERFVVVLFYNHIMYKSNELVFKNDNLITDESLVSLSDKIAIKHGKNSKNVYQDYSITNAILNKGELFVKRDLSIDFITADGALANSQLIDAQIYWYIPIHSTMLDYELTELTSFTNDIESTETVHSNHYKKGYACFYKTIKGKVGESPEDLMVDENDLTFSYHITDYYAPMLSQNTILCKVIKVIKDKTYTYEAELPLVFASYGTSGTDYTLAVSPTGLVAAVTPTRPLDFNITLYDSNNDLIPFVEKPAVTQWPSNTNLDVEIDQDTGIAKVKVALEDASNPYQGILIVKVDTVYNKQSIVLTRYYPIPWSTETSYYIEGADSVIYNSQGTDPTFYKNPYVLHSLNEKHNTDVTWRLDHYNKTTNKWLLSKLAKSADKEDFTVDKNFLPTLDANNMLCPCGLYVDLSGDEELSPWVSYVSAIDKDEYGDSYAVWVQPIVILQNRYPSPMLNAWDGSFQIDEANGTIMSTMMGAGQKTTNNTFEGVLMGDIREGAEIFDYNNKTGLGIYGFNDGAQSFGFNIDGTAFMGKSGRGRILMDGNKGQISSASYQATRLLDGKPDQQPTKDTDLISGFTQGAGMMIDLDDGIIDIRGTAIEEKDQIDETTGEVVKKAPYYVVEDLAKVKKDSETDPEESTEDPNIGEIKVEVDENNNPIIPQQSHIRIDARSPYFTITSIQGKDLVSIGNKGYFIQSDNYVPFEFKEKAETSAEEQEEEITDGYGMKIDLHQGSIDAYNLKITSKTFFVNSRKDATANFIVRDPSTNKNLIYMGTLKPNEEGKYPTEVDKIKNIWYLQSGNYTIAEFDENNKLKENTGSGMKIDLGTGQIDAYNFKLTSKNVFIDSTDKATTLFAVKDHKGKYLVHFGALDKESPTEEDLKNIWYLQSSNYLLPEGNNPGAGMKIDLGLGHIDAYNFKLTSNNVLIDSREKIDDEIAGSKIYFEIKANNPATNSPTLESIFKVTDTQATLAGWVIDNNSIRFGALGTDGSMWLCRNGTSDKNLPPKSFVGGDAPYWCIAVGKNFGVNNKGEMFGRGVTIKNGDITIYKPITNEQGETISEELVFQADRNGTVKARNAQILGGELKLGTDLDNPTTVLDSAGNLNINNVFTVSKDGEMTATKGTFGPWTISSSQALPGSMTSVGFISAANEDRGVSLYVDGVIYNFYTDDHKGASSAATWEQIVGTAQQLYSDKLGSVVSSDIFYVDDVALGKRYKCQFKQGVLVLLEITDTYYEIVTQEDLRSQFAWSNTTVVTGVDFKNQKVTTETLYYWG